jgi:hypothetical protein
MIYVNIVSDAFDEVLMILAKVERYAVALPICQNHQNKSSDQNCQNYQQFNRIWPWIRFILHVGANMKGITTDCILN